jgi:hypothetical protein
MTCLRHRIEQKMTDAVTNASCEPFEVQFTQQELFDLIKEHTKQFEVRA